MIMLRHRSHSGARIDNRHGSHTLTSPAGVQETGCGTPDACDSAGMLSLMHKPCGGFPIKKVNGEVVGAIGLSGAPTVQNDVDCASAALALVPDAVPARRFIMNNYTHQTAPTQFVEANSIRFAYRRFGKTGGVPLVFSQHYIGTMDYWDPTVTDGLARDREVILFNNAGVSSSSGEVPTTFEQMGAN